jgi:hypothetical protein
LRMRLMSRAKRARAKPDSVLTSRCALVDTAFAKINVVAAGSLSA